MRDRVLWMSGGCAALVLALVGCALSAAQVPPPAVDAAPGAKGQAAEAVLAGGCFWGVEAVFERVRGVSGVVSGYAGGRREDASYETVSSGQTGHAESVRITYDPSQVTYGKLLQVFFAVVHDPTQLDRQGPDWGTQYRSAIFYGNEEQKRVAEAYLRQLNAARVFGKPLATKVTPLEAFYPAEEYHQNFIERHPDNSYVMFNDLPKLEQLHKKFPELEGTR
jgi:peptide-methionine (S)-S-oxide reductase